MTLPFRRLLFLGSRSRCTGCYARKSIALFRRCNIMKQFTRFQHGYVSPIATRKLELGNDERISSSVQLRPIIEVAANLNLSPEQLIAYGPYKAKVMKSPALGGARDAQHHRAQLILVTAMSPTKTGEGKTTTTVGLCDAMNIILAKDKKVACCALREPSLGPVFGMKGGGAGGGRAQIAPMQDINLHFNGDFHAVSSAHNLLAALVDNHIYFNKSPEIDPHRVVWKRAVDMNDRALRETVVGLSSKNHVSNGFARQDGFDITAASEVMAILCLADSVADLRRRLGNIIVGYSRGGSKKQAMPIRARDIDATDAMLALLHDAFLPNLVQTLEHSPALVHGGPFANLAHGCNSVVATQLAMDAADYVVTEAGFGADLGAEKFLHIKCRAAGVQPDVVVMVVTARACKLHGGCKFEELGVEDVEAVRRGLANVRRHVENMARFGLDCIVCVNKADLHTPAEERALIDECRAMEHVIDCQVSRHYGEGGQGALAFAQSVLSYLGTRATRPPVLLRHLYDGGMTLQQKVERVATQVYRATDVVYTAQAMKKLDAISSLGDEFYRADFPVCMAKTQYSFSDDAAKLNAPDGHTLHVTDVRLSAGAEFVVIQSGDIMTMPGLPRSPSACSSVGVTEDGVVALKGTWVDAPFSAPSEVEKADGARMVTVDHEHDPKILSGKLMSRQIRSEIRAEVQQLEASHGVRPGLAVVVVGSCPDSAVYVRTKSKFAHECGFHVESQWFPEDATEQQVLEWIETMNGDDKIHGILCQLPLPTHLSETKIVEAIAVEKDADGFRAYNVGATALKGGSPYAVSCTPLGVMELLKRSGVEIAGKKAVVLGRSNIVGMPLALLLEHADATVTVCHSHTPMADIREEVSHADIVCAAVGKAHFVPGEWIKPGSVVVDVGINVVNLDDGKRRLVGDVEFPSAYEKASLITPVPGGIGPMTVTMLLQNTLTLCKRKLGLLKGKQY